MMKSTLVFFLRAGAIWITVLVASVIGAGVIGMEGQPAPEEGPLNAGHAFLFVNGLHALVLCSIATRSVLGGWKLGALLAATLFFAQSFLLVIEAIYFAGSVNAPLSELMAGGAITLIAALGVGVAAPILWRRSSEPGPSSLQLRPLAIRIAVVAFGYVVTYFTAGYFIAWAVPEVRAFYGDGLDIELLPLLAFQIFRGALWGLLALTLVRSLQRGAIVAAVIVGATFSILAAAQLLYPNPFMPWAVRLPHLIEVGISNFLFGAFAAIILRRQD